MRCDRCGMDVKMNPEKLHNSFTKITGDCARCLEAHKQQSCALRYGSAVVYRGCCSVNPTTKRSTGSLNVFYVAEEDGGLTPSPIAGGRHQNVSRMPEGIPIRLSPTMTPEDDGMLAAWKEEALLQGLWNKWDSMKHGFDISGVYPLKTEIVEKRKVYIAGKFSKRDEFKRYRASLMIHGYDVVSSWIDQTDSSVDKNVEKRRAIAMTDLADIDSCDIFLYDAEPSVKGGMHYQMGYARAKGKNIYVIGETKMLFATLEISTVTLLHHFKDWYDLLAIKLPSGVKL